MQQIGKLSRDMQKTPQRGSTSEGGKTKLNPPLPYSSAVPASTPRLTSSLLPHERDQHRARIAVDVEIVLDGYWQSRPSDLVKAGILADWMDTLEDWHVDQIRFALRKWRDMNPSKKPNPSHILAILKGERGKTWVAQREGREADPVFAIGRETDEQFLLESQS